MNEPEPIPTDEAGIRSAVERAQTLLASADNDTRWQGAILLGEFCESAPAAIWPTVVRYGSSDDDDMRTAIATCVLEHVLEYHFEPYFSRTCDLITAGNRHFVHTLRMCAKFGQTEHPTNRERFDAFLQQVEANVT